MQDQLANFINQNRRLKMFILFLKRGLILGVFFAFFFFACENTPFQNYNNQDSTVYNTDDDDTSRSRTRSRSSSSGSSSSGSSGSGGGSSSGGSSSSSSGSGGSSTGEPDGPTVSGYCPPADKVARYSPLTTITFKKLLYNDDETCEEGRYSHPLYNKGPDRDSNDDCSISCNTKYYPVLGSASSNQNTILFINSYDYEIHGSAQQIRLNARAVGELWKREYDDDDFYIYFKIQGQEAKRSELKTTRYRWSTCVCSGQSRPVKVTVAEITDKMILDNDICNKSNVVKVWLAKYDGDDCRFY